MRSWVTATRTCCFWASVSPVLEEVVDDVVEVADRGEDAAESMATEYTGRSERSEGERRKSDVSVRQSQAAASRDAAAVAHNASL